MAKSATPQVWQGATTAVQDRERPEKYRWEAWDSNRIPQVITIGGMNHQDMAGHITDMGEHAMGFKHQQYVFFCLTWIFHGDLSIFMGFNGIFLFNLDISWGLIDFDGI